MDEKKSHHNILQNAQDVQAGETLVLPCNRESRIGFGCSENGEPIVPRAQTAVETPRSLLL